MATRGGRWTSCHMPPSCFPRSHCPQRAFHIWALSLSSSQKITFLPLSPPAPPPASPPLCSCFQDLRAEGTWLGNSNSLILSITEVAMEVECGRDLVKPHSSSWAGAGTGTWGAAGVRRPVPCSLPPLRADEWGSMTASKQGGGSSCSRMKF